MGCCGRFVGVPFRPRRFSAAVPLDLAQNQSRFVDPAAPMGDYGEGPEGAVYVVQAGDDVRLSAIARKLGLSAPGALSPSEQAVAPAGWAGELGAAKVLAAANGHSWEGPPMWRTYPVLSVGGEIDIPPELAGTAGKKSGVGWVLALAAGYLLFR